MARDNSKFKHLIARVDEEFYREVKVRLAQRGMTMHQAVVRGVAKELDINLDKLGPGTLAATK